jgi:hypothetical protein
LRGTLKNATFLSNSTWSIALSVTVTLLGPQEIIEEVSRNSDIDDLEMDEPQAERGLADAVDSPIGPEEFQQFFQLLTVAIGTATSAVVLFEKIKGLLKKTGKNHVVKIKNPKNNKVLGEIGVDTDVRQLAESLLR